MKRIVTIRPPPGDAVTVGAGREIGLAIDSHPLFEVIDAAWDAPDASGFDGVLIGSANALRHGGRALDALHGLPAFCVGAATARAARNAGFAVAAIGSGGLQNVLADAAAMGARRLLRLAGQAHVPLDPPAGMRIDTRVCYRVSAKPIDARLAERLRGGALVLLHSAEAAGHFAAECDRLGLSRARIALACLGHRIAERVGEGWAELAIAGEPADPALLALAKQMCITRGRGAR